MVLVVKCLIKGYRNTRNKFQQYLLNCLWQYCKERAVAGKTPTVCTDTSIVPARGSLLKVVSTSTHQVSHRDVVVGSELTSSLRDGWGKRAGVTILLIKLCAVVSLAELELRSVCATETGRPMKYVAQLSSLLRRIVIILQVTRNQLLKREW